MEMKWCPHCEDNICVSLFGKNKCKPDGLQSVCKACKKLYSQNEYKKNTQKYKNRNNKGRAKIKKWFQDYKKTLSCLNCTENDVACLDFHHTDPTTKSAHVGKLANAGSINKLKEEITKCVVLCANCHRKLHYYE